MAEKGEGEEGGSRLPDLSSLARLEVFRNAEQQGTVERLCSELSRAPPPKQLAVGGAAGWVTGYLTMKAGKMAATAIGGTLLLVQIAHHKGYIKVGT